MSKSLLLNQFVGQHIAIFKQQFASSATSRAAANSLSKSWKSVKKASANKDLALSHFDGLYAKVYGRAWPSARLGLLSPKKQCAILNSFVNTDEPRDLVANVNSGEQGPIDLARYYKKHQQTYTIWRLRQQIIENKKARKRELLAKNANVSKDSIDPDTIEVSDVSDSELRGAQTTDASEGFSSAEDLVEMFSDRRVDEDDKYFFNRASTQLSLNDYVPATQLIHHEEIPNDLSYYEGFNPDLEPSIEHLEDATLEFCDELKIYTHSRGDWSKFKPPTIVQKADLFTHYLLDGASILPVLALDLHLNDECADYCAAPGGKSLAMLMTLRPKYLLCNDISSARLGRLAKIMKQYAPDISYLRSTLHLARKDASRLIYPDTFDKILVDAPCSNDRTSAEVMENNIFKRARTEERLRLPTNQCDMLKSALKSLKPKGVVVYSTCTMSPIENDGVVQRALLQLQEEGHPYKFAIVGLKEAFRPLRGLFKFKTNFKYGQQVLPSVCSNFGPMYISKIKRLS